MNTYTFLLVKKDGKYVGWSRSKNTPKCGEPDKLEWVEWNKPLPEDIDGKEYTLEELKELYKDWKPEETDD